MPYNILWLIPHPYRDGGVAHLQGCLAQDQKIKGSNPSHADHSLYIDVGVTMSLNYRRRDFHSPFCVR